MVLSKSIKTVDTRRLFYNKFMYRATLKIVGARYLRNAKNIQDVNVIADQAHARVLAHNKKFGLGSRMYPPKSSELESATLEKIIEFKNNLAKNAGTFRIEHNSFTVYTNDTQILNELLTNISSDWEISLSNPAPDGVILFKNDPPAKYRAYLKNQEVSSSFRSEMTSYITRTPSIKPSPSFNDWLKKASWKFLWGQLFIDYDDDKDLFMLRLMFSDIVAKTYKLEKK